MDSRAPDSWTPQDDRNADGAGSSPWPPSATGPTDGLPRRHGEPEVPAPSSRMRRRGGGPRMAAAATLAAGLAVGAGIAAHASTTTPPTAAAPAASSAAAGSQGAGWNGPYGRGRLIPGGGPVGSGATSQALAAATSAQETGVVDINVTLGGTEQAAGTGMILTSDGEVLTNRHVVEGETSISVTVTGRTYSARVVGISTTTDVAVVHLTGASGLATVKTSSAAVAVGTSVVGVGNAGGTGGTPSAAAGTVTGVNQSITASDTDGSNPEQLSGLIETDAGIQPGDSGGPLLNASDTVVGMDTAASSQGDDAYAIPIATALAVAHQIETGGSGTEAGAGSSSSASSSRHPYLGVQVQDGDGGPLVDGVVPGSPADDAGLSAGDTITSVAGHEIGSAGDLAAVMASVSAGQAVTVTWTDQNGAAHTARLTPVAGLE